MLDRPWSTFFLTSTTAAPPLRIGIALDDDLTVTRAQASIIDDIRSCDFAEIVIAYVQRRRISSDRGALAWRIYRVIDRRRVLVTDDPDTRGPLRVVLPDVEIIRGPRGATSPGSPPTAQSPRPSSAAPPDVILDLSRRGVEVGGADLARHGTWALMASIDLTERVTRVSLVSDGPTAGSRRVLADGVFAHDPLAIGPSRATATFGSTHLVIQKLRELHDHGWRSVVEAGRDWVPGPMPSPSNWEVVRSIGPTVARKIVGKAMRAICRRDEVELWRIALRANRVAPDVDAGFDMSGFEWIEAPRGHLFADPVLVQRYGRTWLFVEDYSYNDRRGVIACAEISAGGQLGPMTTVLSSSGHLSYPNVFWDEETAFMIPESSADGRVTLYRADAFPFDWVEVATLHDGAAVDTTVCRKDDRWWFFTTLREPRAGASMLMLFSSASPYGPWEGHPSNPISLDVRDSRGAGPFFEAGGRLVRPSQDCSRTYGYSFGLNEVLALSPTTYSERRLITIRPTWGSGLTATHTYSRTDELEAADGRITRARGSVV
jgi:hypothetical protein